MFQVNAKAAVNCKIHEQEGKGDPPTLQADLCSRLKGKQLLFFQRAAPLFLFIRSPHLTRSVQNEQQALTPNLQ